MMKITWGEPHIKCLQYSIVPNMQFLMYDIIFRYISGEVMCDLKLNRRKLTLRNIFSSKEAGLSTSVNAGGPVPIILQRV